MVNAFSGQLSRHDGNRTDWVTPDEIPDPNPLPKVYGWNLLIRPIHPGKSIKFKSGVQLELPSSFTEDMKYLTNIGKVLAIGPLAYTDPAVKPSDGAFFPHGKYREPWCKVGDYVMYGKHQGVKMMYAGVSLLILADDLIVLNVDDPAQINPMFNLLKDSA